MNDIVDVAQEQIDADSDFGSDADDFDSLAMEHDDSAEETTDADAKAVEITTDTDEKLSKEYENTFDGDELLEHKLQEIAGKCKTVYKELPVSELVLTEFKRVGRKESRIGLTTSVGQWGVLTPIHVMQLEDANAYIVLEGLRRVYAAVRNKLKTVPCIVWTFDDKNMGKRLAGVLTLMLHKTEDFTWTEKWEMYRLLEDMDNMTPKLMEYLLNLHAGQAMKLKDVMLCSDDYADIREKLLENKIDLEAAYRKLNNARKKEQRLAQEDAESAVEVKDTTDNATLDTVATDAILDFTPENKGVRHEEELRSYEVGEPDIENEDVETGELCTEDVDELLQEADSVTLQDTDVTKEALTNVDQTDDLRQGSIYQKVGQRHPIDKEVRLGTFIRDGFKCRCCGMGGSEAYLAVLAFHHAIPVYAGGPDTKENGLTLCVNCHILLHTYLQGKLVLDTATLQDASEIAKFERIMRFGNIANAACKKSHVSKKQMQDINVAETVHPRPEAYINENKKTFVAAQRVKADSITNTDVDDTDIVGNDMPVNTSIDDDVLVADM